MLAYGFFSLALKVYFYYNLDSFCNSTQDEPKKFGAIALFVSEKPTEKVLTWLKVVTFGLNLIDVSLCIVAIIPIVRNCDDYKSYCNVSDFVNYGRITSIACIIVVALYAQIRRTVRALSVQVFIFGAGLCLTPYMLWPLWTNGKYFYNYWILGGTLLSD